MCLKPVKIRNPKLNNDSYGQQEGELILLDPRMKSQKLYIEVPCGQCPECRATYINSVVQRAIVESLSSYVFFITMTYDNEHIPTIKIDGKNYLYANYEHIQNMFKRLRKNNWLPNRDFRYLCVNEYGDKRHRPHWHLILFVAKKDRDTAMTPYFIEKILFNNLQKYYADNTGTDKNPNYERLFTYQVKYTKEGVKTNYFIKYVENTQFENMMKNEYFVQDLTNVKTIQYLTNYVNKPNIYGEQIERLLNKYKDNPTKYKEYKYKLKTQIRYSKGFGCGFKNGSKFYMNKISHKCSKNTHIYTEMIDNLPETWEEFMETYPEMTKKVMQFQTQYAREQDLNKFINELTEEEYILHCVYLKYFKHKFSDIYQCSVKKTNDDKYQYQKATCRTYKIQKSPLYNYLRKMVDESIEQGCYCISFKLIDNWIPMCKYYRDRVCTFQDTLRLYDKLGVKNFDEWMELFTKNINNNKATKQYANVIRTYDEDEYLTDDELKAIL